MLIDFGIFTVLFTPGEYFRENFISTVLPKVAVANSETEYHETALKHAASTL